MNNFVVAVLKANKMYLCKYGILKAYLRSSVVLH